MALSYYSNAYYVYNQDSDTRLPLCQYVDIAISWCLRRKAFVSQRANALFWQHIIDAMVQNVHNDLSTNRPVTHMVQKPIMIWKQIVLTLITRFNL